MKSQTVMKRYSVRVAVATRVSAPAINVRCFRYGLALDAAILSRRRFTGTAGVGTLRSFYGVHFFLLDFDQERPVKNIQLEDKC
jgi:hypothetical protein